jgi:tRNA-splicing ligase RtcB
MENSKTEKMELKKINDYTWEIPQHDRMQVAAIVYTSSKLLSNLKLDNTLQQIKNVACLPGIKCAAYAMPDAHQGYGFPIGGVAAFSKEEGIISPGGVGYDINCGVRLLSTDFLEVDIHKFLQKLIGEIFREVPAGIGKGGLARIKTCSGLKSMVVCLKLIPVIYRPGLLNAECPSWEALAQVIILLRSKR